MRRIFLAAALLVSGACRTAAPDPRLDVRMVTDEADTVLAILDEQADGRTPAEAMWQRLFSSEGYRRLKQRETSMGRAFGDEAFREFVRSPDLLLRAAELRRTLGAWTRIDPADSARRAFAYLPASAVIRAKVYPVIKPRKNSFVFETDKDPAIFLYLDPEIAPAKLANTVTHELHHIGVGSACRDAPDVGRTDDEKAAMSWMTGFSEGRAVLAAAGGPDVYPHEASSPKERADWERDFAKVDADLPRLESFFVELLDGRVPEDERTRRGMSFISTDDVPQGPFYTVGWLMSSVVERELGRKRLVDSLCHPPAFLRDYDRAAKEAMKKGGRPLPLWSEAFLTRLPGK